MKFLVIYATTEGQTRKISEFVQDSLTSSGHDVELLNSARRLIDLDILQYDAIILAGSVHQQKHQESITNFVIAHRQQLQKRPVLFISVSLSIAFNGSAEEALGYLERFINETGLRPASSLLVAGALRFAQYDYFMEQIVEFVVLKDQEKITEDCEFTDWDKLREDIGAFAGTLAKPL